MDPRSVDDQVELNRRVNVNRLGLAPVSDRKRHNHRAHHIRDLLVMHDDVSPIARRPHEPPAHVLVARDVPVRALFVPTATGEANEKTEAGKDNEETLGQHLPKRNHVWMELRRRVRDGGTSEDTLKGSGLQVYTGSTNGRKRQVPGEKRTSLRSGLRIVPSDSPRRIKSTPTMTSPTGTST